MRTIHPSPLLRGALIADFFASGMISALHLSAAQPLAELLTLPRQLLADTGIFLVFWTVLLAALAASARMAPAWVGGVVIGNVAWATGSVVLLATAAPSPGTLGLVYVLLQACAVLTLAAFQYAGLARSTAAGDSHPAEAR